MKDQPWDLNQSIGSGVDLQMPPNIFGVALSQIWGVKTLNFGPFFCDFCSRHCISPKRNVASTNQNASVNLQCVP